MTPPAADKAAAKLGKPPGKPGGNGGPPINDGGKRP